MKKILNTLQEAVT